MASGRLHFTKLTGSQRPVGTLFPDNGRRMVFLGTLMLGDETRALRYGRDRERNLIGVVERVGPNRWRIAFPYPHFESLLDVIELVPAPIERTNAMRRKILAAMLLASAMLQPRRRPGPQPGDRPRHAELMTLYRDLHANPELSMQETRSAARMAAEARRARLHRHHRRRRHRRRRGARERARARCCCCAPTWTRCRSRSRPACPSPAGRAARTREGLETGIMHACGHDTHMTAWVGTARRLAAMRSSWSGTLVMIAQPGEETSQGAKAMLEDGLFTRFPSPTHAIAFHDTATLPAGMIGYSDGPALANVDSVDMACAASAATAPRRTRRATRSCSPAGSSPSLQTLVSRELDPLDSARSSPSAASRPAPSTTSSPTRRAC